MFLCFVLFRNSLLFFFFGCNPVFFKSNRVLFPIVYNSKCSGEHDATTSKSWNNAAATARSCVPSIGCSSAPMEAAATVPKHDTGATHGHCGICGGIECSGRHRRFYNRGDVSAFVLNPIATIPVPAILYTAVRYADDGPIHGGRVQSTTTTTKFTTAISATIRV